jgi:hypothetical protein
MVPKQRGCPKVDGVSRITTKDDPPQRETSTRELLSHWQSHMFEIQKRRKSPLAGGDTTKTVLKR